MVTLQHVSVVDYVRNHLVLLCNIPPVHHHLCSVVLILVVIAKSHHSLDYLVLITLSLIVELSLSHFLLVSLTKDVNYLHSDISLSEPTSSPENIVLLLAVARSMIVSWDEVPCSRQNGPITGYLLYYTNTTFSNTINITGGENRSYTLTTLRPYTNYTVTMSAYNDGGIGPASDNRIQQTKQASQLVY